MLLQWGNDLLCLHTSSYVQVPYCKPGVEFLGHIINESLALQGADKFFPKVGCANVYSYPCVCIITKCAFIAPSCIIMTSQFEVSLLFSVAKSFTQL